ncbi:ABC transporter substrate-binding protein [Paenibacillus thermotolerans]|uniref:ABC transporter substrate-binding protein n=1 Tax=Paenibacillus thermotolerans TaxID=3027807 RepID=UPI002367CF2E|nr:MULTISPECIES: sugar ABC transporter substrate-binding protein [unclassified Paenibacillus]
MRLWKKPFIVASVLIIVVLTALSGCSSVTGGGKTEIVWLVRTDPNMIEWEKKMIADFEKENPKIKVKLEQIPQNEIDQRLTTMISSGKVPDVWSSNWANSGFATYLKMGALLDMTPYIEKDAAELATINQDIMNIYKIDGKIYGVPMLSIGSFLFYNKDLLDAAGLPYPPTDWDDESWNYDKMLEYAKALTKDVGDPEKQVFGILNNDSPNKKAWAFGGDFFRPEAYTTTVMGEPTVMRPENLEAIQFNVDLIHKHKVAPNQATLDAVSQLGDPFMTGRVAMVINGGWGFWAYKPAEFRWGVAPIPWHEKRQISLYVDPWNISAKSKHPDEAWELVKFLVNPKNGGKTFMESTSATPADTSLADQWYKQMSDITGMTVDEIKQVNEGAIKYGRESDNHLIDKFSVINDTINQTVTAIWNAEKSVEDGMKEVEANLKALKLE